MAARELEIPIILLSQLSRQSETRKDHRPILSDLRESGSIEQDADMVLFIYRGDMYNDVPESERESGIAEIIIAKNRAGKCDTIKTKWVGSITSFLNLEKDANAQSLEDSAPFDPNDMPLPPPEDSTIQSDVMPEIKVENEAQDMEIIPLSEADELLDIFE
jgi:hypothetical protein